MVGVVVVVVVVVVAVVVVVMDHHLHLGDFWGAIMCHFGSAGVILPALGLHSGVFLSHWDRTLDPWGHFGEKCPNKYGNGREKGHQMGACSATFCTFGRYCAHV